MSSQHYQQQPHTSAESFASILSHRLSRRRLLQGTAATAATIGLHQGLGRVFNRDGSAQAATNASTLTFTELSRTYDATHHVAPSYTAQVLARWGDKITATAPDFDPAQQSASHQSQQFGYNCDFIAFMPLPVGSQNSNQGILCVNNEYPNPHVMFPGLSEDEAGATMSQQQVETCMASVGHSVVEVKLENGQWSIVEDSPYNRRITLFTEIAIAGPAAGHDLMKTSADPDGKTVLGMIYNCGGGVTPWKTVLTCEEGASDTFGGDPSKASDVTLLDRYGYDGSDYYGYARFHDRFKLDEEANESNRFDWVVEIDPYDASVQPVKRTALGRFAHEAAACVLNKDGRVVVYMGDDDYFEYLYRFVSDATVNMSDRAANQSLLDNGVLSVAKFDASGMLTWMPLVFGEGPLTPANGFNSQAEVLIKTRLAADLLEATPMDRPEDFEANPITGRVYAVMTKNKKRTPEQVDAVSTRAENHYGQIVELIPPGTGAEADHTASQYQWDMLLLAGDPQNPDHGAKFNPETSNNGWFVTPDNIAFDPAGHMWVATDGGNDFDLPDGIYGTDTEGTGRALPKLLFACPYGAEATGPCFTPDGQTLFVSVQHPAENSDDLATLTTRWPDFQDAMPARPAVVAILRENGGVIGS